MKKNLELNENQGAQIGIWTLDIYQGDVQNESTFIKQIKGKNLITTLGKGLILDRLSGIPVSALTRIGAGTSGTAAAAANTTLTGSFFKVFDSLPTRSGLTVSYSTTFTTADANLNWQELGMDNGTSLFNRIAPIGPFNKTSAVSIVVTVTITQL
jgi:Pyruvate/2-oxoacid:ferredoxin oxidoreductase gamma subunit